MSGATTSARRASLAARLGLALGVTVVLLLCGEVALRGLGPVGSAERERTVFDPFFGVVRRDSWIFDVDPRAASIDVRGQVAPAARATPELRVLCVGDSGTEGPGVELAETFPLRFAERLREADPARNVRVINAGVWGMTTIDEYYLLEQRLLPLDPDVVVLGLFLANDINFNLVHRAYRVNEVPPSASERAILGLARRSALANFVYLELLALNSKTRLLGAPEPGQATLLPIEMRLIDEHGFHMVDYAAGEVALYHRPPSALVERAFDVLRRALSGFAALGELHGFRLVVLLIPAPVSVLGEFPDFYLEDPRFAGATFEHDGRKLGPAELDFEQPSRRVLEICRDLGLACVDGRAGLAEVGRAAFLPRDNHLSAAGHAALARTLAESRRID